MKHTLTALALAGMIGVSSQAAASLPLAEAELYWPSFTVTLFDLDLGDAHSPEIFFIDRWSEVYANDLYNWPDSDSFNDWTTHLSIILGPAQSSADGSVLNARTYGPGNAYADRWAGFYLSPMTRVEFNVSGSVEIAGGMGQYADIYLYTEGTGATGSGLQSDEDLLFVANSISGRAGTLTVSFWNRTGDGLSGEIYASAFAAAPIPEPETYAMMLAGLGLVGWMVARRRRRV